jgi:hypothetical protein
MKVLRIPANGLSSDPVKETDFDQDQFWRYEVVRRVGSKVFIAERCAEDDYLSPNSVANKLADRLASEAGGPPVGDSAKSAASRKKLHGPVMVAYYDRLLDRVTSLDEHDVIDLMVSLKEIDSLISVERLSKPPGDVAKPEAIGTPEKQRGVGRPEGTIDYSPAPGGPVKSRPLYTGPGPELLDPEPGAGPRRRPYSSGPEGGGPRVG